MTRALVLIDKHKGMTSLLLGARNNNQSENSTVRLLAQYRSLGRPVEQEQHLSTRRSSPRHADSGDTAIKPEVAPIARLHEELGQPSSTINILKDLS